jgi:NAD(P)-dependent dehydrogenase (short-subunit alcohol dehydrogenase family)
VTGGIAVVTGSAGGIGSAIVRAFAAAGWSTLGVDRARGDGCSDRFVELDLAAACAPERVLAAIPGEAGVVALVNNAAVQIARPLTGTTPEEWQATWDVNVRAPALLTRALAARMAPGSAILNIASVHALATSAGLAAYATSKGALTALTRAAALELAPRGIRVNAVLPGAVNTEMLAAGLLRSGLGRDAAMDALVKRTPLQRVGTPAEIAQAVLFLCDSSRSGFITGQCLTVDGGASARLSSE